MVIVTVWPCDGVAAALPELRAVEPHVVMLHSNRAGLASSGPRAAAQVRAALPGARLWGALGDDAEYSDTVKALRALAPGDVAGETAIRQRLTAHRVAAARAVHGFGAELFMPDDEGAHEHRTPGFDGQAATDEIAGVRAALPGLRIAITSFDEPGEHDSLPWHELDAADVWAPQVYFGTSTGAPAGVGAARDRVARFLRFWQAAVARGELRDRPVIGYLQAHGATPEALSWAANQFADVAFWAAPSRWSPAATFVARALVLIEREGFTGPGRVAAWQHAHGLSPDCELGPKSAAALGLAFPPA